MSSNRCAVCGHVNRVGAAVCEMCDARPGDAVRAGGPEASGESFGAAAGDFATRGGETRAGAPPSEIPSPQFKGAGDVISPTLELFRKNFLLVGLLVVVTSLPFVLLEFGTFHAMTDATGEAVIAEGLFATSIVWNTLLGVMLTFAASALLSGSLVYAVVDLQLTGAARAGESLRRGLGALPKVFVVTVLSAVITWIGFLLLIIPGVIFALMYSVAVPVAVAEGRGPFASLKRSAQLTDGYKWLIFVTYFLWGLLVFVLNMIVNWSFVYGGAEASLLTMGLQAFVAGMLNSSVAVLTVYIYLGLLNERGDGFDTRPFTPGPEAAAR